MVGDLVKYSFAFSKIAKLNKNCYPIGNIVRISIAEKPTMVNKKKRQKMEKRNSSYSLLQSIKEFLDKGTDLDKGT